jgi:hypothetical protein
MKLKSNLIDISKPFKYYEIDIVAVIQNMLYLLGSLFTITASLIAEKPLYDKDFIDKFSSPEDKKKLEDAVEELKRNNHRVPHAITIKLSSGKNVTISL